MRLTPRRRAFIAVVVAWPLGLVYLYLAAHLVRNLAADTRGVLFSCGTGPMLYVDEFNGCNGTRFHPVSPFGVAQPKPKGVLQTGHCETI